MTLRAEYIKAIIHNTVNDKLSGKSMAQVEQIVAHFMDPIKQAEQAEQAQQVEEARQAKQIKKVQQQAIQYGPDDIDKLDKSLIQLKKRCDALSLQVKSIVSDLEKAEEIAARTIRMSD